MDLLSMIDLEGEGQSEKYIRPPKDKGSKAPESVLMNRIQVELAQKRTSLSVLRTGVVLLTLPMSIVAFLAATSKFYDPMNNLLFLIPLFILNTVLVTMGFTLIFRAWKRIKFQDNVIQGIKSQAKDQGYFVP